MTISRVKFPWPPFFRILIFFDEVFNTARGTTYLMRDDGATVVNLRPSRVIWSLPNPTYQSGQPCILFELLCSDVSMSRRHRKGAYQKSSRAPRAAH